MSAKIYVQLEHKVALLDLYPALEIIRKTIDKSLSAQRTPQVSLVDIHSALLEAGFECDYNTQLAQTFIPLLEMCGWKIEEGADMDDRWLTLT